MAAPAAPSGGGAGGLLSNLPKMLPGLLSNLGPKQPEGGRRRLTEASSQVLYPRPNPLGGAVHLPRRVLAQDGVAAGGGAAGGSPSQNAVLALAGAASNAWNRLSRVPGANGRGPAPSAVAVAR